MLASAAFLLLNLLPAPRLADTISQFAADQQSLERTYPVSISPKRAERFRKFYRDEQALLRAIDFDKLDRDSQVDYVLLDGYVKHELRGLDLDVEYAKQTDPILPFAATITGLEESRRKMETIDPAKVAQTVDGLVNAINDSRRQLESGLASGSIVLTNGVEPGPPSAKLVITRSAANRAVQILGELRRHFEHWFEYYDGYDPMFSWWVRAPHKSALAALDAYTNWVKERLVGIRPDDKTTIIGFPIGRDALIAELAYERIPYTPEELLSIADKQYAWCLAEMKKASAELGYGNDWHKALEHVKQQYVEPGKQTDLIRDLAFEAIDFVEKRNLVTIPPLAKETFHIEMMSPEAQLRNPFFTGGEVISVSYPTDDMTQEQKMMSMRGNNRYFARATVFHELIPGHHLQGFISARSKPYRRLFYTPFSVEGWALYCEMLMWDLNFPKTPEDKIGMLFWRMHRCARIQFSLRFHLGQMTPEQCVDLLVKSVGHERENALGEVRRSLNGGYGPLYQAAYMLGGLQIMALKHDLVDSGKMNIRDFHDAVLANGQIPIDLVRAAIAKTPLGRETPSTWRFAG